MWRNDESKDSGKEREQLCCKDRWSEDSRRLLVKDESLVEVRDERRFQLLITSFLLQQSYARQVRKERLATASLDASLKASEGCRPQYKFSYFTCNAHCASLATVR